MKTLLLRATTLVTLLLATCAALAQGPGRHAGWRSGAAASPAGLAYGAGYHARRMQPPEREAPRARQATTKTDGGCAPATAAPNEPEPARAREPGRPPAQARRDACVAPQP